MERKLSAILYADVAGYSRLTGADEVGTHQRLKVHLGALTDAITEHGGRICHFAGDAVLADFPSIVSAVNCAVFAQRKLGTLNEALTEDRKLEFRIGVNLGEVMVDEEEIYGSGVNVAARLEALAEPGGICISRKVFEEVDGKIDAGFAYLGPQSVKNIAEAIDAYNVLINPDDAGKSISLRKRKTLMRWPRWIILGVVVAAIALWLGSGMPGIELDAVDDKVPPLPVTPSIAVLPFVNQSADPSQEYFSDGLTDDLISRLGRFPSLTVMARNAVFPYKGRNVSPAEIGRELSVRYIVEGSVRRAQQRIRVNAQLIEAKSGKLLWSRQYDENLRDVFALQDEISRNVAGALEVNMTKVEQLRALAKPTDSLNAYDLVLRGRERLWQGGRTENREARQLFEQAIHSDPKYAMAYAWLARAYVLVAELGWAEDPSSAMDRAVSLAREALSLEPDNLVALSVLGTAHAFRGEYGPALSMSNRLLAINPSDARGLFGRLAVLLWLGKIDEAIEAGETGLRFDPNPRAGPIFDLGLAYYQAHRHSDAVRTAQRGVARYPDYPFMYALLAAAYAREGRMPEATQALASLRRLNPFFDAKSFGSRFQVPEHRVYLREGLAKAGWK